MAPADRRRASSSSSTSARPWAYEVFFSFRGEDTRYNFTDHLYASFLFDAIEESRFVFVILSKNYASSKWCLKELEKIMECREEMGKIVFPVFYHVDPSPSFAYMRWRAALREVGNISGWHVQNGSEADIIEEITSVILMRLNRKLLPIDKNLVGMDCCLKEIIPKMIDPLSNDVRMIGIYGLGGIGKTTIAKVFDFKSQGLPYLQKQLLHDILPGRNKFTSNVDEGIYMIKDRLCFKKVPSSLASDHNWFGPRSRIIITTRDKHLLDVHEMDALFEAKKLNHKEAVELFKDLETLSNSIVQYVNDLPLGLKVLGLKLSKDFEFPSSELRYLYWHGYPLESLPSSFYAEDLVELDMCYSNLKQLWESDMLLEKLNTIRISCSQHLIKIPDFLISALNLEKLILDGCSSLMEVHPSIGRLNKLILLNLKNCKKLRSFPSIIDMKMLEILNFSGCSELKKFPDIQGNMEHLSELYLASTAIEGLPSSIEHLTGLVLLDLKRCKNLKSLPTCTCKLKSLEHLSLSDCSKLESFPEMIEHMECLKELLLDGTSIEVLPSSIEHLKGLVLLNLRKCKKLVSLLSGMCSLRSLETLIVSGCSQLDKLPKNLGSLQGLVQLLADGTAITLPPDSIVLLRNLRALIYPGCKIIAPTSLSSLFSFWLLHRNSSDGIGLCLPSFPYLSSFTNLSLSDCKLMEGAIPDGVCSLISLKKLDLSRNNFLSIPAGISELTNLKDLRLGQCQNLIEIPELPPCVQDIDPYNCTSLSASSSGECTLQWLQFLFYNCSKPVEDESSVYSLTTLAVVMQKIFENIAFSIVFPGIEIPEWIWHQNVRYSIKIELPTDRYNDDFLGFVVCSVFEHFPGRITCHLNSDVLGYGKIMKGFAHDLHLKGSNVGSKHVWLGYQPLAQLRLLPFIDPNDLSQI
ncbi:hypothetical protein PVL29_024697 [Vitis rotundifolia]|uniref:TIR domain-containing protein n=1 Tax=Vitis rotundifolia TaxID=103349 RepID=A0AA39D9P8_VITRO|nr:hypothetical protein PVL29_024697 [Vitis rotundifolia]